MCNEIQNNYVSNTQKIRVLSEMWAEENLFCPCCGNDKILKFPNNKPVADFYCDNCNENFELKSKKGKFGRKIVDGAYDTAVNRILSNDNPNLFVLSYNQLFDVTNLEIIPKYFFTIDKIEKRKPLSENAHRAGWVGSNILYSEISQQGKIAIIKDSIVTSKEFVISEYNRSKQLKIDSLDKRGWLLDVLQCVEKTKNDKFSLSEIYQFSEKLKIKYPENHNVEAKIRQQLQILRDKGYIIFLGNGRYKKTFFK